MLDEKLDVNTALPGLTVQYSTNNKQQWKDVNSDTEISGGNVVYLRTR